MMPSISYFVYVRLWGIRLHAHTYTNTSRIKVMNAVNVPRVRKSKSKKTLFQVGKIKQWNISSHLK